MKKILFTARDLNLGGIEKSLVILTNYLVEKGNDVTLVLENKQGILLSELNSKIKLKEYKPVKNKVKIVQKAFNFFKRIKAIIEYKNKYDVSISFATYSIPGSFIAIIASKSNILWGHADYLSLFNKDENKMRKFFEDIHMDKFSKIVFVSKTAKDNFLRVFPEKKNCTYYCNNLIDYEKIKSMAEEKIAIEKDDTKFTFLNVGRHDETQKKLTRIIEASRRLKEDGFKFRVIFVGSGESTHLYKELVEKYNLNNYIIFEGSKENPYPYFKISDCVILSSDYEGYPVVFLESFILNKPLITTKVSDYEDVENKRGLVCEKNTDDLYNAMKIFLNNGYILKEKFDCEHYNNEIKDTINELIL